MELCIAYFSLVFDCTVYEKWSYATAAIGYIVFWDINQNGHPWASLFKEAELRFLILELCLKVVSCCVFAACKDKLLSVFFVRFHLKLNNGLWFVQSSRHFTCTLCKWYLNVDHWIGVHRTILQIQALGIFSETVLLCFFLHAISHTF